MLNSVDDFAEVITDRRQRDRRQRVSRTWPQLRRVAAGDHQPPASHGPDDRDAYGRSPPVLSDLARNPGEPEHAGGLIVAVAQVNDRRNEGSASLATIDDVCVGVR